MSGPRLRFFPGGLDVPFRPPRPVKPGDTLGVCAPSSAFPQERFEAGLEALRALGYRVKVPARLTEPRDYLAGPDELRLENFAALMEDPDVKGLIAARGGYGAMRLLPALGRRWRRWPEKPLIGFSDITALHLARLKSVGLMGLHGPVLTSLTDDPETAPELALRLARPSASYSWSFRPEDVLRGGRARGPLLGGNLTLLVHLLATGGLPKFQGAILMVEDIGEAPYRLDRLFATLRQSSLCRRIGGLVCGAFTNCGPPEQVEAILRDFAAGFHGPVVRNAPFGHEAPNRPWLLGAPGELSL